MDVSALNAATQADGGKDGPWSPGRVPLADFDQFLRLFVEQLKNQDPLSPMGNEEFMAQTAQFAALEQMVNLNRKVDSATAGADLVGRLSAASLIGSRIEAAPDGEDAHPVAGRVEAVEFDPARGILLYLEGGETVEFRHVTRVERT